MKIEELLQPVGEEDPCGPLLQADSDYVAMMQKAEGQPERGIGDNTIPAVPPDWPAVLESAQSLLKRTKDLEVAAKYAQAALRVDGFAGLDQGLELLGGLVERYWDRMHPSSPVRRMNQVKWLTSSDSINFIKRQAPLVGDVSYEDLLIAEGSLPVQDEADKARIDGLVRESLGRGTPEELEATTRAVSSAAERVARLDKQLEEHSTESPDLEPLRQLLEKVHGTLVAQTRLTTSSPPEENDEGPDDAAVRRAVPGTISSRSEVVKVLDLAIEYFVRHEPSSPVPDYLARAKDLIGKDFMTILRDMAPSGVDDASTVLGKKDEGDDED